MSKFASIKYPLFALKRKPYKVSFSEHKIYAQRTKLSHTETVDDKRYGGDYFSRLVKIKNRLDFDMTCQSTQDAIFSKPKWGLDSRGIFDLSMIEKFKSKVSRIKQIKDNLVFVVGVSYPFKIKTEQNIKIDDTAYVQIVYIDNVWYAKKFLSDWVDVTSIRL